MAGINHDLESVVTITLERYEELLDTETRVNVAVELICNSEYCKEEEILRILGTETALKKADELRDEDKKRHEEYLKKYETDRED